MIWNFGTSDRFRVARAALLSACVAGLLTGCGWVEINGRNQPWAVNPPSASAQPRSRAESTSREAVPDGAIVVARGDTVYALAREHGVPMRALIEANGLRPPYMLQIGQRIVLPRAREHVVQRGETLYSISRLYDVDSFSLANANGLTNEFTLYPGQALRIPGQGGAATSVVTSTVTRDAPASIAPAPKTASPRTAAAPRAPAPIPAPVARSGSFIWPVSGGRLLSGFGGKGSGLHNDGINIAAPRGTPVRAVENGVVAYAGNEIKGFGNMLLVKHSGGWVTAYAHTAEILVKRGARIKKGDIIARVGSSGNVSSPQLHFELRRGKQAVDPAKYLRQGAA